MSHQQERENGKINARAPRELKRGAGCFESVLPYNVFLFSGIIKNSGEYAIRSF